MAMGVGMFCVHMLVSLGFGGIKWRTCLVLCIHVHALSGSSGACASCAMADSMTMYNSLYYYDCTIVCEL